MRRRSLYFILLLFILVACSSLEKKVILGIGLGGATGVATGYAMNFNNKGMLFTTCLGTVLGAGMAYLVYRNEENHKLSLQQNKKDYPRLITPIKGYVCVMEASEMNCVRGKKRPYD